jgi:chemotaxis protein histidine kinase CheA
MTQPTPPPPGKPLGMTDFFALEAGEYLERLDAVLQPPEGTAPLAEEFVRLARALRGSALMASQQAIARAAAGLEALARALREARRPWDAATKQIAVRAVDDLKIFVRRASAWTAADTAKAEALAAQLEQVGGRPSGQGRAVEGVPPGLDAGARAFVAREGAAIASTLDRAAQTLRTNPLAHDPLQAILRALQPLRGLAALNDLPPLPDLLEGIERAIGELERARTTAPPGAAELFQAGATAIARGAREVAERGRPDPESKEFQEFAGRLVRLLEAETGEGGVVPIGSLYFADSGPHIVRRGTSTARPAVLGRVELVSHGEHLQQVADSLERAPSPTQRELRAHTLAGTFRALAGAGGGPLAEAVAGFALAGREAVTSGAAVRNAAAFAAELRRAGGVLSRSSNEDETSLATELEQVTQAVRGIGEGGFPAETTAGGDAPVSETPDLVGTWVTYTRLVARGIGPASLEALLQPPSADTARPAAATTPSPAPPVRATAPRPVAADGLPVVDVRTLLYRGKRAQQRAQELRQEARQASGERLRALVEEVCDLVALAIEPGE